MKILCVTDFYEPGYLGGGPITTISNLTGQLSDCIDFYVFTRDRDLGSAAPYSEVVGNKWVDWRGVKVFYSSPDSFGPAGLEAACKNIEINLIYLNSFFSPRASIFVLLRHRWKGSKLPILLAPRGEFSPGALKIKAFKKKWYLFIAKILGLYKDVFWQASTEMEVNDIWRLFPDAKMRIFTAPDPVLMPDLKRSCAVKPKEKDSLRLVFVSRISPKKNLDGLINILMGIDFDVYFDIFGPIEDSDYWRVCMDLIRRLPANIRVKLVGALRPSEVAHTFSNYDLFALPTQGENFGHVIFESLSVGTPVVISDQTPWTSDEQGSVTVIPLSDVESWRQAIILAAMRDASGQKIVSDAAIAYASKYVASAGTKAKNLNMFRQAASIAI